MRMIRVAIMMLAVAALSCDALAKEHAGEASRGEQPFRAAIVSPADVDLLLEIDNAAAIRAELVDRPIARWITAMIETSEFHQVWKQFAAHTQHETGSLFDMCFGRRVSVLFRREGEGRERSEWALITEINVNDSTDLLRRLQPRTLRSRSKFSIYELPEHDFLIARRGTTVLVGPREAPLLMLDVLARHGERGGIGRPLADTDDFDAARQMESGNIALFMRHERPLGGHSAIVLELAGERIHLRHRARFASPPFARDVTRLDIDVSPLDALERHALVAVIEPADIGMGPIETFLIAALGEGLVSPEMRATMGRRRIIVLGEIEGRQEAEPVDLLAPTIALGLELKDVDGALADADEQVVKLVRQLVARGDGRFTIDVPEIEMFADDRPRQIDVSSATRWFTGSLPIAQPMTLNWSVVDEPDARYAVYATHPDELRDTMASLARATAGGEENRTVGRYQSSGTMNGVRISHHLESWAERADLFFGPEVDDGAPNDDREEFQQTLKLMSKLAAGIDRLRWRLARPSRNEMHLDVRLTLVAPESAREQ